MSEKKKPKRERPPEKESILKKLREYDAYSASQRQLVRS